jgi:hypothetical protein
VSVSDCSLVEGHTGAAPCAFLVNLSNPSTQAVSVGYSTAMLSTGLLATPGEDYTTTTGTVTFPAETAAPQPASVPILGDQDHEWNEAFQVNLGNPANATIADGQALGTIIDDEAARLHVVTPCRVLDTRQPDGPSGGPVVLAGPQRTFPVAGQCGVPVTAKAVLLNVTTTGQSASGSLRVFPAGLATPATSSLNFAAGRVRANNATVLLGTSGQATLTNEMATGQTHVIVDVFGYYSVIEAMPGSRIRPTVEPPTAPGPRKASEDGR